MPTSQTPQTQHSLNEGQIPVAEIAYYNQRLRNHIFGQVLKAFAEEAEAGRINKAELARKLGKEPPQITRWFSGPSNWTLDTISSLLVGIGAELDTAVVFLRDRAQPNYAHPLVEQLAGQTLLETTPHSPARISLDDLPKRPTSVNVNSTAYFTLDS